MTTSHGGPKRGPSLQRLVRSVCATVVLLAPAGDATGQAPEVYQAAVAASEPFPLKEPGRIDELRASVGLPPLSDYIRMMEGRTGEEPSRS